MGSIRNVIGFLGREVQEFPCGPRFRGPHDLWAAGAPAITSRVTLKVDEVSNPVPATEENITALLRKAWAGEDPT